MLIFLHPSDLSRLGWFDPGSFPTDIVGPISVHGILAAEAEDILPRAGVNKRHCDSIVLNLDTRGLNLDVHLPIKDARTAQNFAHVFSWFFAASFGVRIESLHATSVDHRPFHIGIQSGFQNSRDVARGLGKKMSSASCLVCNTKCIASLAESFLNRIMEIQGYPLS